LDAPNDAQKTSSTHGSFPCRKQIHPDEHDAGIFPALPLSVAAPIAVQNRNGNFVHRKMNRKIQPVPTASFALKNAQNAHRKMRWFHHAQSHDF